MSQSRAQSMSLRTVLEDSPGSCFCFMEHRANGRAQETRLYQGASGRASWIGHLEAMHYLTGV